MVSLAGVAATEAQTVYSINAVGFVNVTVPVGFSLLANPLLNGDNKVGTVLAGLPDFTAIYKFNPGTGSFVGNNYIEGWQNPNMTLAPGEGVFINNTSGASFVITFTGEVAQGNLVTALPAGFSIVSSQVPQSGALDSVLGFPVQDFDAVFKFNAATQTYQTFKDFEGWGGSAPTVNVGEAVFVNKASSGSWTRNFNISAQ